MQHRPGDVVRRSPGDLRRILHLSDRVPHRDDHALTENLCQAALCAGHSSAAWGTSGGARGTGPCCPRHSGPASWRLCPGGGDGQQGVNGKSKQRKRPGRKRGSVTEKRGAGWAAGGRPAGRRLTEKARAGGGEDPAGRADGVPDGAGALGRVPACPPCPPADGGARPTGERSTVRTGRRGPRFHAAERRGHSTGWRRRGPSRGWKEPCGCGARRSPSGPALGRVRRPR